MQSCALCGQQDIPTWLHWTGLSTPATQRGGVCTAVLVHKTNSCHCYSRCNTNCPQLFPNTLCVRTIAASFSGHSQQPSQVLLWCGLGGKTPQPRHFLANVYHTASMTALCSPPPALTTPSLHPPPPPPPHPPTPPTPPPHTHTHPPLIPPPRFSPRATQIIGYARTNMSVQCAYPSMPPTHNTLPPLPSSPPPPGSSPVPPRSLAMRAPTCHWKSSTSGWAPSSRGSQLRWSASSSCALTCTET